MSRHLQRTNRSDVSVTKSITDEDGRQFVTLTVVTTGTEPRRVRVTDRIDAAHALSFGEEGVTLDGGTLCIEVTVWPDEAVEFGYYLDGSPGTELPDPTVETVPDGDVDAAIEVEWTGEEGRCETLAVTTETVTRSTEIYRPTIPGSQTETASRPERDTDSDIAVGLVLTVKNEDAALLSGLRARRHGHAVLVTYAGVGEDADALVTLSSLGATVVTPPPDVDGQAELNRLLSRTAREKGYSGLILQTRDCPRIDYERTRNALKTADYEVIAVPEQWEESADGPKVVVGIPAYNAEGSIAGVVESASAFADEVIVVDDGSRDQTAARAREAGASVVVHKRNRGYGGALKTLFREAANRETAHLVVIDADGQHDPGDIPELIEAQNRDDADIVIGSRYVGERTTKIPFVRSIGLAVINNLTNLSLGRLRPSGFVRDTQSGYRVYSNRAIHSLAADRRIGNNMGASTDILYHAHRNHLSVSEVGTTISYDVENASSQGSLSHGLDLIRNIVWTVEYGRPLLIVGTPGIVSTLLGTSVSILLIEQYVESGVLPTLPLTVSVLYAIGGVLLCIMALVMHVLNDHPTMRQLGDDANS